MFRAYILSQYLKCFVSKLDAGSLCSALLGDVVPSNVIVSAPSNNHFSQFQVNHKCLHVVFFIPVYA